MNTSSSFHYRHKSVVVMIKLHKNYEGVTKSFRTESVTKYMFTFGITR